MTEESRRNMRLLDGRRVQLNDLMDAGLLVAGATLVFDRPRLDRSYTGEVTTEGRIRLEDGREFAAPSRAAMEAADLPSIDGWFAWTVSPDGARLADLRRRLLTETSQATRPEENDSGRRADADSRSSKLEGAYQAAENGDPWKLTVRDFIGWWGAKGRGHRVVESISADLDNHSLETHPDFRKVSLDAAITIVAQPTAFDDQEPRHVESPADANDLEVGLTLGNVPSALAGITSVKPDDSLETAMTLMRLNDFSQLAVMTSPHSLRGSVTWRSIAKALAHESGAILADAIEPARERSFDHDLIDVLVTLYDHEFVFVRNAENKISGIVTATDVVKLYGETATPFFILGEIDHLLRGFVSDEWTIEQVIDVCDPENGRAIESHDDLSFGDYQRMLEHADRFAVLGWPLDRRTFVKALNEVREIRNRVAHFDPDPLEPEAVALLRNFLHLLRELRGWAVR